MLFELALVLLATGVGVAAGIVTGLLPGVHINLVSVILLSLSPIIAKHVPLLVVSVLIVVMAITHTFLDTIPSIFLGAPDDDKAMGVLPGHRYLLRGNGLMAVKLCVIGGVLGILLSVVFFIPLMWLLQLSYAVVRKQLFWVMFVVIVFVILKDAKRLWAFLIFSLSGTLGLVVLRLPLRDPLLPLLSGMFGVATLLYSINEQQTIPLQRDEQYTQIDAKKTISGSIRGLFAGLITALLPGVSAASASAISAQASKLGDHGFLVLLGSLGSASFLLSLAAYIGIQKARNGAMAVVVELSSITPAVTLVLISGALVATGIAAVLTIWLGRKATILLPLIPYRTTCICVILFVAGIVALRAGWLGVLVLLTSTAVGLLPAALKTARAQGMGCLLLPLLVLLW